MNASQKKGLISLFILLSLSLAYKWWSRSNAPTSIELTPSAVVSTEPAKLDLNGASVEELEALPGIGAKLADRIVRFRELIGGYRQVRELMGIRGLTAENLLIIEEHVSVDTTLESFRLLAVGKPSNTQHFFGSRGGYEPRREGRANWKVPEVNSETEKAIIPSASLPTESARPMVDGDKIAAQSPQKIDLNLADSTDLVKIKGIGAKTAAAILRYRERLGFFRSVDQLLEIKIIFPENFARMAEYLYVDSQTMEARRIDLNSVSMETLGRHPYVGWTQAKMIIAYREAHGPFHHGSELVKIRELDAALTQKMEGYFVFGG